MKNHQKLEIVHTDYRPWSQNLGSNIGSATYQHMRLWASYLTLSFNFLVSRWSQNKLPNSLLLTELHDYIHVKHLKHNTVFWNKIIEILSQLISWIFAPYLQSFIQQYN